MSEQKINFENYLICLLPPNAWRSKLAQDMWKLTPQEVELGLAGNSEYGEGIIALRWGVVLVANRPIKIKSSTNAKI